MDEKDSRLHPEITHTVSPSSTLATRMRHTSAARKRLLLGLVLLALTVLTMGLIYFYWYQNPQKVLSDALMHAVGAKSLTYTGNINTKGSPAMDITVDGGTSEKGGILAAKLVLGTQSKNYTLEGNAVIDEKNDLYFKVRNIDDLVNNYRKAIPAESLPLFDNIINTVNDKWIIVSSKDLQDYSQSLAKSKTCVSEVMKKIQTDATIKSQLMEAYKAYPFMTVDKKLGAQSGSLGYALSYNPDLTKGFTGKYKTTTTYKTLAACDKSFVIEGNNLFGQGTTAITPPKTTVWIDQWTHHLTKITLQDSTTTRPTSITIEPKFNRTVTVVTPKDVTTLEQLQRDVQGLLQSTQKPSSASVNQ
jgi:hypothetical protein